MFYSKVLKIISIRFLAIETAMLRICSKFYQYASEKLIFLAYKMQGKLSHDDKFLPLNPIVSQKNFKAFQISD